MINEHEAFGKDQEVFTEGRGRAEQLAERPNILEMRSITKRFPGVLALDNISFSVRRGEIHAICGENGAGKSTLMKVLSGVYPHGTYDGEIFLNGEPVEFKNIRQSEEAGIVIIHQELALSPYQSIAENIFLGNELKSHGLIDWPRTNREAAKLLARVGLDEKPTTLVSDIGVGKQQLVEIAKALSKNVKLLILDEPTAALNDEDSAHLLNLMRHLRGQEITCIMISHKLDEIEEISDSTTVIRDGQSVETMLMSEPDATQDRIIRGMVGRPLDSRFPEHEPKIGEELLRIENWTVHHPIDHSRKVVDNASLTVHRGEIVGVAGLMGAGRTELAMSVFGRAYGVNISGEIYKDGTKIDPKNPREAIEHGIAYVSEDRKSLGLNLIQSIRDNVSAAGLSKLVKKGWVDAAEERAVAEKYRKLMNIRTPNVEAIVGNLSGGNQQKVALGKWLFTDPDILILDEPTRGIDVGAKFEIYQHINAMADSGRGLLVISSELPELLGLCDRIYTVSEGRVTGQLSREEATQEKLMTLMTQGKQGERVA